MTKKKLIPCIYLYSEKVVTGFAQNQDLKNCQVTELARHYSDNGADALLVFDMSKSDDQQEEALLKLKEITANAEIPVMGAGNIKRVEDVKKILYTGCTKAFLNVSKESNIALLEEVSKRFGKEKIGVCLASPFQYAKHQELIETYASTVLYLAKESGTSASERKIVLDTNLELYLHTSAATVDELAAQLKLSGVAGISGILVSDLSSSLMTMKTALKRASIDVEALESRVCFADFKLNSEQMIPVIVQDYQTDEVLMLAYMNEQAFHVTLETGKMTYWSRSRNELWTKGLTSGHVQYVKSLQLDCDQDTLLAKVSQVGAACHTGNRSCFFQEILRREYKEANPLKVFQDVYDVILDRQANPKEGSYTNYLFDKGIDKILKKVGEECTEIVIAAKNPEKEEIKYEIADFLYHIMVLMAEKGVTWEEIITELAHRS